MVLGQADSDLSVYNTAGPYSNGDSSYITAAWDEDSVYGESVPSRIVVGDGVVYTATVGGTRVTYRNIALKSDTRYEVFTRYDIGNELNPAKVSANQTKCVVFFKSCFWFLFFGFFSILTSISNVHSLTECILL